MMKKKVTVPGSKGYIQFHSGPDIWDKRWKALRKWIHSNPNWSVMATTRDVEIHKAMTEITRKIK